MITIRDATPEDADQLSPLLEALGYPTEPGTLGLRLRDLIAHDPTGRVLVAVQGPELLGFATQHGTPVLHRPTPVGRITGLAVRPGARGSGAGRMLVEAAESHCRALGWARLEVTSGPTHQAAYDFYRHLGYQDHGVRFAKPLLAPA